MRSALAIALALLVAARAAANPSPAPKEALDQGRTAYERGDYGRAIDTIHPLIYPSIELGTEDEVVQAHRLLALSYFFVNKTKDAEEEVTSLLAMRPNYQLDPIMDPPVAVRFFDDVRRRQSQRLEEIRRREATEAEHQRRERERREAEARAKAQRVYVDRVVEHHSRFIALVPFGVGQVQNGQTKKAIAFGVSETALGLTSLVSYILINTRYATDPQTGHHLFPPSDATVATTLYSLQLAAGAAFWGVLLWGVVDAQVLFKPEVVRSVKEHGNSSIVPARDKSKISIAPILSPSLAGIGLQGSF
jgi:hypothetical protein